MGIQRRDARTIAEAKRDLRLDPHEAADADVAAQRAEQGPTQKEIAGSGIKVTAFAPAFVDTPMTEFVKGQVAAEAMIRPEDIAEAVRFLLRTTPNCLVPEMVFLRPGDTMDTPELG